MSHTVTVTRTTTTTSTSAIILNTGYCKTIPGLLKIAEIIVGAIIVILLFLMIDSADDHSRAYRDNSAYFFKHMVVTFLIGSLLLLLGCLVSISTGSIIAKTSYEFIYHGGALILYAAATIWVIIVLRSDQYKHYKMTLFDISSVLGILNSVLYGISCFFAYKSYRWP